MGSSQESKNLSQFSETDEGKSIVEIGSSSFEQNIYVCGNYDIDFFSKNIINSPPLNPRKPRITNYIKMAEHKHIDEWHFFFSPNFKDYENLEKNVIEFLNEHNNNMDFDDFKENSKTRIGKTTILYFNDENKDKFANYFIKKCFKRLIPFIIFIGNQKENKELKELILKGITDLNRDIDPNIFKFCNFKENLENNLIDLNINLIECAAFYNELGDEFKFPKKFMDDKLMENDLNETIKNFATFNILICGRPGVGKSTFINNMIKAMICKASTGKECSSRIVKYIHRTLPITFYDTPGISTKEKIQVVINLIKNKNKELNESKTKIHAVFYLLSALDSRKFLDFEIEMFKVLLKEFDVPVFFIITKMNDLERIEEEKDIVIQNYKEVTKEINDIKEDYKNDNVKNYIHFVNVIGKNLTGVDELFLSLYDHFKGKIIEKNIDKENIADLTKQSLIGELNNPNEIIPHPTKLCEQINLSYRLVARSVYSNQKGSTFLSAAFLRNIRNVFGIGNISIESCKKVIEALGFAIDNENKKQKKNFKSWFKWFYDYQTPAEEEISYLANNYIKQYKSELEKNEYKCLQYINKLRINLNKAIEGLNDINKEYRNLYNRNKTN